MRYRSKVKESTIQASAYRQLSMLEKFLPILVFAVPNGGHLSKKMGAIRKGQGARAGVPDLIVLLDGGEIIQIEMKIPKGDLSPNQKLWRDRCQKLSIPYFVARSADEAREMVLAECKRRKGALWMRGINL